MHKYKQSVLVDGMKSADRAEAVITAWRNIDRTRCQTVYELLNEASTNNLALYIAIQALFSKETINHWNESIKPKYKLSRKIMLQFCVLQRFTVLEANQFLTQKMYSYAIHPRDPEEAAYHFVLQHQEQLCKQLDPQQYVRDEVLMRSLTLPLAQRRPSRMAYKKARKEHLMTTKTIYPITKETIGMYCYRMFAKSVKKQPDAVQKAMESIVLAIYADNLGFWAQSICNMAPPIDATLLTIEHTSVFARDIEKVKNEAEFVQHVLEKQSSFGAARLTTLRILRDDFNRQAINAREREMTSMVRMLNEFGQPYLLHFLKNRQQQIDVNHSVEENRGESKTELKAVAELWAKELCENPVLLHLDYLFGNVFTQMCFRVCCDKAIRPDPTIGKNDGGQKVSVQILKDDYCNMINDILRLFIGVEWENVRRKKVMKPLSLTVVGKIKELVGDCGLDHPELTTLPDGSVSRPVALATVFHSVIEDEELFADDRARERIIDATDRKLEGLGLPQLSGTVFPDYIFLYALEADIPSPENIRSRMKSSFTSFFSDVYGTSEQLYRQERYRNVR